MHKGRLTEFSRTWWALPGLLVAAAVALGACLASGESSARLAGEAPPYAVDLTGRFALLPLLTVGAEVPLLDGTFPDFTPTTATFAVAGLLDGLGVLATADAYFVFANHEYAAGATTPLSSAGTERINGARVSLFQFTRGWEIVGGKNLIDVATDGGANYVLDPVTGDYVNMTAGVLNGGDNFSRFCTAFLAAGGFLAESGGATPIWFAPEESGSEGRGWAVTPDGWARPIDGLGRYSKEQVLPAAQYRAINADRTVLLATEDTADGELYLYVGTQTPADPNGFSSGQLHVLRVANEVGEVFAYETMPEGQPLTGLWTPVPEPVALGDGQGLSDWVNEADRSTNFRRLEDIHEDPAQPGTFYVATTGRNDIPPGGSGPDNAFGKLYRFSLNPADPTGPMPFELVLVGGATTGVSYDNLVVDSGGQVLIQEDRTAGGGDIMADQERYGRVLAYDPQADAVAFLFEANQAAIDPASATDYGNWETSGIVELAFDPVTGRSSYLFTVQAHSVEHALFLESGQLLLAVPIASATYLPFTTRQ